MGRKTSLGVARALAWGSLAGLLSIVVGVESLYCVWLPVERPRRADRPLPDRVRRAIWVEFGGTGTPRLMPYRPFLLTQLVSRDHGLGSTQGRLLHGVAVQTLTTPMRTVHFLMRSTALATWVSRNWTAEQAIDAYGSRVWMGDPGGYGLESAAQYLWGRGVDSLEPHEIAALLAIARAPKPYDPACRPDRALAARNDVLDRMYAAGVIDGPSFERAVHTPLVVKPTCRQPGTRPRTS